MEDNKKITIEKSPFKRFCKICCLNNNTDDWERVSSFHIKIPDHGSTINIFLCLNHTQDLLEKLDEALSQPETNSHA